MVILIDNGHGSDTPGKRSPDGRLMEWKFSRAVAHELLNNLKSEGLEAELLVPEDEDIPLRTRVARANKRNSVSSCLLVSIHVNATWNGGWHNARGFSSFIAPQASANSQKLAALLTNAFREAGLEGNRRPGHMNCYRGNFAILRDTHCPAVLTENLFMVNRQDLEFLLKPASVGFIASLHAKAIIKYLNCHE